MDRTEFERKLPPGVYLRWWDPTGTIHLETERGEWVDVYPEGSKWASEIRQSPPVQFSTLDEALEESLRQVGSLRTIASLTAEVERLRDGITTLKDDSWALFNEPGSPSRPLSTYRSYAQRLEEILTPPATKEPDNDRRD